MAEYGDTRTSNGSPDGDSDVEGSTDVIVGGVVSEMNPSEPGVHQDHTGQIANISNILTPQADRALREVPELLEQLASLSVSAVPQDPSRRNVFNFFNEINVMVGDNTDEAISPHLKTKIRTAQKIFVETVGYEFVCECLDYHGHVLICGSPGSGKTTMSLCIMGQYLKKNYNVVFLEDVSDFNPDKHVSNHVPTLIVFDDIFGYFSLTTKELVSCKKVFNFLKSRFQRLEEKRRKKQEKETGEDGGGNDGGIPLKVIMNSRTNVLESIRPKLGEYRNSLLRSSTIANLTTLTKLDNVEKERILRKHLDKAHRTLSDYVIKTIAHLEYSSLGFPHLCELFVDSLCPQDSAVDFFKEPMMYLVDQMTDIFGTDESRGRAGVLLLMVLNDGVVSLVDLQSEDRRKETGLDRKLTKCEEIVDPLPSPEKLYLAARNEKNTFLSSEGDVMKFSHPTIHDAVAFVVGDIKPLFVFENCSLQFILERTKVIEALTDSPSRGDFTNFMINLTPDSAVFLVKRLVKEISDCNFALPLSHQCFSIDSNVQLLFKELSSMDNMETCLHSQDRKYGMGFLFWSSFVCTGPLCELSLTHTSFSVHEVMEGCFGCCMSGNVESLQGLMSYSLSTEEITSSTLAEKITSCTLGEILDQRSKTRSFYRNLSSVGSPGKTDAMVEKETARMHGNTSDMLIHIAAANGFSEIVQVLLEHGAEIDAIGGNKMTAVMHACYLGHTDLAKLLLAREADSFILDEEGDNCLHLACRSGSLEILRLLHEKQMDLNTRGEHDRTPLMYASYNGHEHVVKFLLEKGAVAEPDVTQVHNKDNSLHLACIKGYTNVVKILLNQGYMDIEMLGQNGRPPLMYACRHGQLETAKELVSRGAELGVVDDFGFTCLHMAAAKGHIPTAEWLLSKKAVDSVDCLSARERTPLMQAFQYGQTDMVYFLLEKGANITLKDTDNLSCLHVAAKAGVLTLVDLCLKAGLDVNSVPKTGITPAMSVCSTGDLKLLQYLEQKGADVRKVSTGGCLHSAALGGSLEIVKYLLAHFPELDINLPGYQGMTPLMISCSHDFIDVAKYLVFCGANVGCTDMYGRSCLHVVCQRGFTHMIEWLLSLDDLDIDGVDISGMTPLMYAVKSDNPEAISLLVEKEANLFKEGNEGRTYLHSAAWYGKAKSCTTLLDRGMKVDVQDRNNRTPLMSALSNKNDRSEVIQMLLERGASIHAVDSCNKTPAMYAIGNMNVPILEFLLSRGANIQTFDHRGLKATLLHFACSVVNMNTQIPQLLITRGLDVNVRDRFHQTPAMCAARKGNRTLVEFLIRAGANLRMVDKRGRTCLSHAEEGDHRELVEYLQQMTYRGHRW